jgi:hypothetical protein
VHQFGFPLQIMAFRSYGAMLRTDETATQREVVRLVLERERELHGVERLLGSGAVAAVKTLAADGVAVRNGELLWASSALTRLDELGLITCGSARPKSVDSGANGPAWWVDGLRP